MTQISSYRPVQSLTAQNTTNQPFFKANPKISGLHKDTFQKGANKPIHFAGGLNDVAGMTNIKQVLQEQFISPVRSYFTSGQMAEQPLGLLLYGPGRTYIAKKVVDELQDAAPIFDLSLLAELKSWYPDKEEETFASAFQKAAEQKPSIIVISEFDSLIRGLEPGSSVGLISHHTMLRLLHQAAEEGIIVIGTSGKPLEQLDPAITRAGRMGIKLEIPLPDSETREGLFRRYIKNSIIQNTPFPLSEPQVKKLVQLTNGCSAGDIDRIVNMAARTASYQEQNLDIDHIQTAIAHTGIRVGGLHEIVGMADIKRALRVQFISPIRKILDPSYVKKNNIKTRPANGLLLYGPPGTGKTHIGKQVAEELQDIAQVFELPPDERARARVGETERLLKLKFDEAARSGDHSFVFIDEFDSLAPKIEPGSSDDGTFHTGRRAAMLVLLQEAAKKGIIVIGTSNKSPDQLDEAVVRAGRMDVKLEVPMPDTEAREGLFRHFIQDLLTQDAQFPISQSQLRTLALATKKCSPADIKTIVETAAREADDKEHNLSMEYIVAAIPPAQKAYLQTLSAAKEEAIRYAEDYPNQSPLGTMAQLAFLKWQEIVGTFTIGT